MAEKSQDVFCVTRKNEVVYNGCRNREIHRLSLEPFKKLSQLEPPHYDIITGLGWLGECLVSVSKDKHLKVWAPDRKEKDAKPVCIDTCSASEVEITLCRENREHSMLFTADKRGDMKFWRLTPQLSPECLGGIKVSDVSWYHRRNP